MRVLGIETSCDETGVALYDGRRGILGECLYSQIQLHQQYGGVVPELSSRDHIRKLIPLIDECLQQARRRRTLACCGLRGLLVHHSSFLFSSCDRFFCWCCGGNPTALQLLAIGGLLLVEFQVQRGSTVAGGDATPTSSILALLLVS